MLTFLVIAPWIPSVLLLCRFCLLDCLARGFLVWSHPWEALERQEGRVEGRSPGGLYPLFSPPQAGSLVAPFPCCSSFTRKPLLLFSISDPNYFISSLCLLILLVAIVCLQHTASLAFDNSCSVIVITSAHIKFFFLDSVHLIEFWYNQKVLLRMHVYQAIPVWTFPLGITRERRP